MFKTISAIKARKNLGELLEEVFYNKDHVLITRRDKAMAVMISIEDYEKFMTQREEDFAVLEEIRNLHPDKSPEQVEQDVTAAIKRVRSN